MTYAMTFQLCLLRVNKCLLLQMLPFDENLTKAVLLELAFTELTIHSSSAKKNRETTMKKSFPLSPEGSQYSVKLWLITKVSLNTLATATTNKEYQMNELPLLRVNVRERGRREKKRKKFLTNQIFIVSARWTNA